MSLKPEPIGSIPEETVRVAKAAFPQGEYLYEDARRDWYPLPGWRVY